MRTVKQMLEIKGYDTWTISPWASVYDALVLMAKKNIGAVLVMDADNLVGIMSERDYARKVILKGKLSKDTLVREIMSERVVCVRTDHTSDECMELMTNKRIRHLPVLENNRLVGVISIGDVVKSIISEQKAFIDQLESYIWGDSITLPALLRAE